VKDTVIALGSEADSVDLTLTVPLAGAGETFELTIALIGTAGDTVFRAGPLTVTPVVGGGTPPAIPVPLAYTGVGADAASVVILVPETPLFFGQQLTLRAVVLDSADQPIPGAPVEWRSLDSTRVRVARPDSGRVIAQPLRGPAPIVARLLTDQADTVQLLSQPTPSTIAVSSGNNQSALPGAALAAPLVAQVLAADAQGVAGVWVRFAVVAGGGTLGNGNAVDSAPTGADGRAQAVLTLGGAGPQVVEATTASLPNGIAIFSAAAVAVGAQVSWINASGGAWSAGANWSTGVTPGPADTAVITLAGTYTVTLDVSPTIAGLTLGGATGTQSLEPTGLQTLRLAGDGAIGANGRVNLVNGDLLLAGGNVLTLNGGTVRVGIDHSLLLGLGDASELTYAGGGISGPGGLILNPGTRLNVEAPLSLDSLVLLVNDAAVTGGGTGRLLLQPDAAMLLQSQTGATVNVVVENGGVLSAIGGATVLNDSLYNAAGATLQVAGAGTAAGLTVNALDNSGTVLLAGTAPATLTIAGAGGLANRASGEVTVLPGASHVLNATLANQGTVTLDGGLTVNRASAQHLNSGLITVAAGQTLTIIGGTFTNAAGNPNLQIPPGVIGGEGTLDVSGTTFVNDGTVAPGFSPGLLSLTGAYPGSPTSLLDIELGGTAAGTEYDRLAVSGAAALDGALNVTLVNGFTPGLGNQFTILTYGSMSGAFRSVLLPTLPLGLLWQTATNPTSMVLSVTGPPPRIVFAGDSAGRSIGVFRVNPDASGLFNVTTEGKDDANPRWSPDRLRITYSARATSGVPNQLHVISADGGTPAHLTSLTDTSTWFPRYNPTGQHLAFECGDRFSQVDVCVIPNVDGPIALLNGIGDGAQKIFVTDFDQRNRIQGPGAFAWDPVTTDRLAWVRDSLGTSRIFTSLFDGTDVQPLSPQVLNAPIGPLTIVDRMDWSPDGNRLVFVAQDGQFNQKLYLINRDGSGFTPLTSGAGTDFHPVFSPDGQTVLFFRNITTCSLDLWRIDATGANETQVTSEDICDIDTSVLGFDWSPDGTEIVVSGFDVPFQNLLIYRIPATTTAATYRSVRQIAGRGTGGAFVEDIQPSWRP
jgi:hypothetical protein